MRTLGFIALVPLVAAVIVDSAMSLQAAADALTCQGRTPTITGAGAIFGRSGNDEIEVVAGIIAVESTIADGGTGRDDCSNQFGQVVEFRSCEFDD